MFNAAMWTAGASVKVYSAFTGDVGTFTAVVVEHLRNHDGNRNGITRIRVTDPGLSMYRVNDLIDVGTTTLRPA